MLRQLEVVLHSGEPLSELQRSFILSTLPGSSMQRLLMVC